MILFLLLACAQVGDPGDDSNAGADSGGAEDTGGGDDTGTPSASVAPGAGDLLVNELMYDPDAVDGDFGEWVELRNLADHPLELQGLGIVDSGGTGMVVERSLVVAAGDLVVFGVSDDPSVNGGVEVDYAYSIDDLKFGNDGDAVGLILGELWLDVVSYDAGVEFPYEEGASIQLDPSVADPEGNDSGAAWCLSTATYGDGDRGTPGAPNHPCG